MPKRSVSILSAILLCFIIIIIGMIFIVFLASWQYDSIYTNFHQSYSMLAKVADIQDSVDSMNADITLLISAPDDKMEAISKDYARLYKLTLNTIHELSANLSGDAYYSAVDVRNLFLSFDENFQKYKNELTDRELSNVYKFPALRNNQMLRGFIFSELGNLSNILIKESQSAFEQFYDQRRTAINTIVITSLLAGVAFLAIAVFLAKDISKSTGELIRRMRYFIETGQDSPVAPKKFVIREIDSIISNYDKMIVQIIEKAELEKKLAGQLVVNLETKALLHKAELSMLQMQMNPHFLYNTLNSIGAIAQIENAMQTFETINNLVSMLRYSLRELDKFVPVSKEMDMVNHYMYIQNIRFGGKISFIANIEPRSLDIMIPSLIIQPLIENAFVHGFGNVTVEGRIECSVIIGDGELIIQVFDNGAGMNEAKIQDVQSLRETPQEIASGIGLKNVVRRMNLLYGKDHVVIDSKLDAGTRITLHIPMEELKE